MMRAVAKELEHALIGRRIAASALPFLDPFPVAAGLAVGAAVALAGREAHRLGPAIPGPREYVFNAWIVELKLL